MRFNDLLAFVSKQPLFETGLLLAGDMDAGNVRRQLSRSAVAWRPPAQRQGCGVGTPVTHVEEDRYVDASF